jgi:hypothetical protein
MFEMRIITQLLALLLFSTGVYAQSTTLFPAMGSQASSVYPWSQYPPGVTYNGGIPARSTQCGATVTPSGGDDTTAIQNAINACPAGQYVQLSAGVFLIGNGTDNEFINITTNNITLRGVGPGPGSALVGDYISGGTTTPSTSGCGSTPCTILYKNGWQNANMYGIIYVNQYANSNFGTSINLASNGTQGATSITLASAPSGAGWCVGCLVLIDIQTVETDGVTVIDPDAFWGPAFVAAGSGSYSWYSRPYRSISQVVKVTAISGNVVTIESPLGYTFPVAYSAQMTPYAAAQVNSVGIEEMYLYGGGGGHGNLWFQLCANCWAKNIESHWMVGDGVGFYSCYRCELRDSYMHEAQVPQPGGGAYLSDMSEATSNSLFENNIMWNGDKVNVMRAGGPGNVVAYNYMDDPWITTDPIQAEAGVNAGHYTGTHFALLEGNWTHKYNGDDYWGNSIYITVFRNWITGQRGARGPLSSYTFTGGGVQYPYCDCWTRSAVNIQANSFYHNIVGNVIGFSGMPLLGPSLQLTPTFESVQTDFQYENINGTPENQTDVFMYVIGNTSDPSDVTDYPPQPTLYTKTNRQGNFDWFTQSQIWYSSYGGSGTTSTGSPQTLPNSMYLTSKPAFFGSLTWPWVNPSTGTTYTLPAKARFDAGTPNAVPGGGSPTASHDFNGDGKSDILWRDTSGNIAMWLMNGATVASGTGLGQISTTWSVVGQADFNGDGVSDILWLDSSGNIAMWLMNGATVTSGTGLGQISTTWSVVGTGDFNGDGMSDILWRDTSGNIAMWLMNGPTVTSGTGLGQISTAWSVVGIGDFNGDGKSDILWRDTSGNIAMWLMNGPTVTSGTGLGQIPTIWSVVGIGDFNGNGMSDVLWRDTSGNIAMWLMNGPTVTSGTGLGQISTVWSIVETGDYGGDGKSDILWRDTSGNIAMWLMNGATVTSGTGLGQISTIWTIQGTNAD